MILFIGYVTLFTSYVTSFACYAPFKLCDPICWPCHFVYNSCDPVYCLSICLQIMWPHFLVMSFCLQVMWPLLLATPICLQVMWPLLLAMSYFLPVLWPVFWLCHLVYKSCGPVHCLSFCLQLRWPRFLAMSFCFHSVPMMKYSLFSANRSRITWSPTTGTCISGLLALCFSYGSPEVDVGVVFRNWSGMAGPDSTEWRGLLTSDTRLRGEAC